MNRVALILSACTLLLAASCSRPLPPKPDRLKWNTTTLTGDYDLHGHKSPQWDDNAHQALDQYALLMTGNASDAATRKGIIRNAASAAVAAGCDDPMIAFLCNCYAPPADAGENIRLACKAADDVQQSQYSSIRAFYACFHASDVMLHHRDQAHRGQQNVVINRYFRESEANLARAMADPTVPSEIIYAAAVEHLNYGRNGTNWVNAIPERILNSWVAARPDDPVTCRFQGYFGIEYAWAARGGGEAGSVNDESWKLFFARLTDAEKALKRGWSMDHRDGQVAALMITVAMGQQKKRSEMETWFKRAMAADTNNYDACTRKLRYLYPQWYGTAEDMLEFGRECVASKNWGGKVPLTLLDVHRELATLMPTADERRAYWRQPDVWPDVRASYGRFFELNPRAVPTRENYAYYALRCGQLQVFLDQIKILQDGDGVDYGFWGGKDAFDKLFDAVKKGSDSMNLGNEPTDVDRGG